MGTKKKNRNYVTEKTVKAKEDALKAKKSAKVKKTTITIVCVTLAIACLITGIVLLATYNPSFKVTHHASIEVEGYGTIHVELYGDEAPETVNNFVKLANEGFYNGLTFHRIMDNFMIQGGDPKADGTGGYEVNGKEQNIKGEFSANGFNNRIKHVRGTISMARGGHDYNSASSQFFIVHQTSDSNSKSLDGNYASFGMVTSGMDVVDKICSDIKEGANGAVAKDKQPVIKSITIHASH